MKINLESFLNLTFFKTIFVLNLGIEHWICGQFFKDISYDICGSRAYKILFIFIIGVF